MACADYGGKRYLNLNGISWTLDGDIDRAVSVRPLAQKMMHVMKMQNVNNLDHVWYTHRMDDGTVIRVESLFGRDRAYVYCEPSIYAKKRRVIKKVRRFVPAICIKGTDESMFEHYYFERVAAKDGDINVCGNMNWEGTSIVMKDVTYPWPESTTTDPFFQTEPSFYPAGPTRRFFACKDWGAKNIILSRSNEITKSCTDTGPEFSSEAELIDTADETTYLDRHIRCNYAAKTTITFKNTSSELLPFDPVADSRFGESRSITYDGVGYLLREPFCTGTESRKYNGLLPNGTALRQGSYKKQGIGPDSFEGNYIVLSVASNWSYDWNHPYDYGSHCGKYWWYTTDQILSDTCTSYMGGQYPLYPDPAPVYLYVFINGSVIQIDEGVTSSYLPTQREKRYFYSIDSHIFDADGVPVLMYAYVCAGHDENGLDQAFYVRYGFFYGSVDQHYQSEKFYVAGIKDSNGKILPFHDVNGSAENGLYGWGQCAGFMVEEEYEVEE